MRYYCPANDFSCPFCNKNYICEFGKDAPDACDEFYELDEEDFRVED